MSVTNLTRKFRISQRWDGGDEVLWDFESYDRDLISELLRDHGLNPRDYEADMVRVTLYPGSGKVRAGIMGESEDDYEYVHESVREFAFPLEYLLYNLETPEDARGIEFYEKLGEDLGLFRNHKSPPETRPGTLVNAVKFHDTWNLGGMYKLRRVLRDELGSLLEIRTDGRYVYLYDVDAPAELSYSTELTERYAMEYWTVYGFVLGAGWELLDTLATKTSLARQIKPFTIKET